MAVGYGTETWCLDSYQPGRLVSGAQAIVQAMYRRFITPRGTLTGGDEEASYGLDIAGFVGAVGNDRAVVALPVLMRAEALKDDRITDVNVKAYVVGDDLRFDVDVVPAGDLDAFSFTLEVGDVSLVLLGGTT